MSKVVKLQASDGHELDAYVAQPEGKPWGGLVVVQEIFGVNQHIRSVADRFAHEGFYAVAPALFDRVERERRTWVMTARACRRGWPWRKKSTSTTQSRMWMRLSNTPPKRPGNQPA